MQTLSIHNELQATQTEKFQRLRAQTAGLQRLSAKSIARQVTLLEDAEAAASPRTRRILDEMNVKHAEFNDMMATNIAAILPREREAILSAYSRYLIQAWYHTRYTPEFERLFGEKLAAHLGPERRRAGSGNKFVRLITEGADEELGHELWALEDLARLDGRDRIYIHRDVFPETRALVRTQYDRLHRLNFKGFLGYSFYLEFYVARHSGAQLGAMEAAGIPHAALSFIRNHRLVDHGHAVDNIELLDFLIEDDEDVDEVLDNMGVIHALYSRMSEKCFDV